MDPSNPDFVPSVFPQLTPSECLRVQLKMNMWVTISFHPFPITHFHRMLTSICLSSFALVTIATGRGMDLTLTAGFLWETSHELSKLPEVLPLWSHRRTVSSRVQVRLSHIYAHSHLSSLHLLVAFVERCGTEGKQRSKSKYAN